MHVVCILLLLLFALENLENLLTSLCMKLVQEVRFELRESPGNKRWATKDGLAI